MATAQEFLDLLANFRELQAQFAALKSKIDNFRGPGIHNVGDTLSFNPPAQPPAVGTGNAGFWAIVVSSTRDGANWRWFYKVTRAYKAQPGYGAGKWAAIPGAPQFDAFHSKEAANGTTGLLGNGVTVENLHPNPTNPTITPRPLSNGFPVFCRWEPLADGTLELWILPDPNGIDGTC